MADGKFSDIVKFISVYYALANCLLILFFLLRYSRLAGLIAALAFMTTPLVFIQLCSCSIDSLRIALMQVALINIVCLFDEDNRLRYTLVTGLLLGLSLFCHSLGLLNLFIFYVLFVLLYKRINVFVIKQLIWITLVALIFVIVRYVISSYYFGTPLTDTSPVWSVKSLHFNYLVNITRGLSTNKERWLYGFLAFLFQIRVFGIALWLVILGAAALLIKQLFQNQKKTISVNSFKSILNQNDYYWSLPVVVFVVFYFMVFVSVAIGMNSAIKNIRYLITPIPFVAILCGYILDKLFVRNSNVSEK